jgi:hypothetical protein
MTFDGVSKSLYGLVRYDFGFRDLHLQKNLGVLNL